MKDAGQRLYENLRGDREWSELSKGARAAWRTEAVGEKMNAAEKTKLLEDALKQIIEEAKRNPYGSVYDLRQIAREALEKIGVKD